MAVLLWQDPSEPHGLLHTTLSFDLQYLVLQKAGLSLSSKCFTASCTCCPAYECMLYSCLLQDAVKLDGYTTMLMDPEEIGIDIELPAIGDTATELPAFGASMTLTKGPDFARVLSSSAATIQQVQSNGSVWLDCVLSSFAALLSEPSATIDRQG